LIAQIDKAKMQVMQQRDPEGFAKLQEQNKKSIEDLQKEQVKLAPSELEYRQAKATVRSENLKDSLDVGGMGVQRTDEQIKLDHQARDKALDTMASNKGQHEAFKGAGKEVDSLEKNVSVREKLGLQDKPKVEGPKQTVGFKR